ncbi:YjbH domain-containing protein [Umboniibacter marinipuniceus]|uniref:Exopolysaccharide biosynthesis protein YbjH n=1 Tax=Umboniibacter marinipuniceus TaxID=569599 RepID=A0A3M0A595_9GAMM|nr:YjbH domain-containing protein [Umboniibacter marinipuniceus]RMA79544.1 exopolysaccharide biosynthesis protein YbjH [Umboniibacter marinipuniceus]
MKLITSVLLAPLVLGVPLTIADNYSYPASQNSYSNFGGVGIFQTPTARNNTEGVLNLGYHANADYQFFNASVQLFPWLESTIRYTLVNDVLYSPYPGFSGDTKYTDKGIDLKARLLRESQWLPELAVGLRDIGGTGLFGGEYIVASKRYNQFDFSLGLGFGYLGQSADLHGDQSSSISCGRDASYSGKGGQIDYQRWFTGCVALFGGVQYQTPYQPLSLKLEYDGNDYTNDLPVRRGESEMPVDSRFNMGAVYAFDDWGQLSLSYQRGNTITLGFNFIADFSDLSRGWNDSPPPVLKSPGDTESESLERFAYQMRTGAGYEVSRVYTVDNEFVVEAQQFKYRDSNQANERAFTLMANQAQSAERLTVIDVRQRVPSVSTSVQSEDLAAVAMAASPQLRYEGIETRLAPSYGTHEPMYENRPALSYSVEPVLGQSFGSAEGFYLYNLGLDFKAGYWLSDHLQLSGTAYVNIVDNFDKFNYTIPSDGTSIPRVRTLVREYLENNAVAAERLQLSYLNRFGENHFYGLHGGYLERMFAGVAGEYFYKLVDSNWAVGMELAYVAQRDPSTAFGIYDGPDQCTGGTCYEVQDGIATGHVSVYYKPQLSWINDVSLVMSAGRYLAGDYGATVNVSKVFRSGVSVMAFATKTNLSAEEYGEGSFTKGFGISIPFDLISTEHTVSRASFGWMPLTRDGGQKLSYGPRLAGVAGGRTSTRWRVPN